jgi:RNA polymerase sigma-B factor
MSASLAQRPSRIPTHIDDDLGRLAGQGDSPSRRLLRRDIIEEALPLADRLARRFDNSGEPIDDLRQVARLGLVKAVDRYDPSFGRGFVSYAIPTITGELKRYFRDKCWAMRVPRHMQENMLKVRTTRTLLSQELRRTPSSHDIAESLDLTEEQVRQGDISEGLYMLKSLNKPAMHDQADGSEIGEQIEAEDHGFDIAEARIMLEQLLKQLPERLQYILYMRYFCNLSQARIAERVGVSQMHVSRLIRQALDRLHDLATASADMTPAGDTRPRSRVS